MKEYKYVSPVIKNLESKISSQGESWLETQNFPVYAYIAPYTPGPCENSISTDPSEVECT